VGVLRGLPWLDAVPVDAALFSPVLYRLSCELRTVVAADNLGTASLLAQPLQHTRHVSSAKPRRDLDAQTLPRAVVNHVEHPKLPPAP